MDLQFLGNFQLESTLKSLTCWLVTMAVRSCICTNNGSSWKVSWKHWQGTGGEKAMALLREYEPLRDFVRNPPAMRPTYFLAGMALRGGLERFWVRTFRLPDKSKIQSFAPTVFFSSNFFSASTKTYAWIVRRSIFLIATNYLDCQVNFMLSPGIPTFEIHRTRCPSPTEIAKSPLLHIASS